MKPEGGPKLASKPKPPIGGYALGRAFMVESNISDSHLVKFLHSSDYIPMPEAAAATCHTLSHLSPEISHLIFFFFVSHFAITTAPDVTAADGISGLR